jgi:hypothetical protein
MATLERDWTALFAEDGLRISGDMDGIERFDPEEATYYGPPVSEGICGALHDEEDEDAEGRDRRPRPLIPGLDGWAYCPEWRTSWRLRSA